MDNLIATEVAKFLRLESQEGLKHLLRQVRQRRAVDLPRISRRVETKIRQLAGVAPRPITRISRRVETDTCGEGRRRLRRG